jgi:ribosomal protein S12 methylthiotransferase
MKVFIDTLGCMKNFNDSEMAMGMLEEHGHEIAASPDEADVIVVNTCGFIEDAKKESISEIFDMAEYKKDGKKLIVSGCLVQRYADELFEEIPEADGFVGVNGYARLPELLRSLENSGGERFRKAEPDPLNDIEAESRRRRLPENPYSASIRIAEGCDNLCSYCVIPEIRGGYRSRSKESLVAEAERLAEAGCKELIVIAQDTSCYGTDLYGQCELPDLLRRFCAVGGIEWIRLMYCYEENITSELIETIKTEDKICRYIDIPLQHFSDKVLNDMNRGSTSQSILSTLDQLRREMPGIRIRTTLMVGFPGETEEDFEELMDFVRAQEFDRLGAFAYSREEGTAAAGMEGQIPEEIKAARLDALMYTQMEISNALNSRMVGSVMDVLIDEIDRDGSYIGRTEFDAPEIDNSVIFSSPAKHVPGEIVKVKILDAFDYDLEGREVFENEFA